MVDVHIGTNRKLRKLTPAQRWCHLAGVLAVASQAPVRGLLVIGGDPASAQDYAELAGVSLKVARTTVDQLRLLGVIVQDHENGCERVHDWDDVNPEPKHDATAAERMRRFRARQAERNGHDPGPGDRNVTDRNAVTVTPGREGKRREESSQGLKGDLSSSSAVGADEKATKDDKRLCRLLAEFAKARNPKFKVKARDRWLTQMRLLREQDDNSPDEIEQAIRWLFTDTGRDAQFWADTIQSAANLREHFAQIWAKMQAQPRLRVVPDVETSDAYLKRRGEAS